MERFEVGGGIPIAYPPGWLNGSQANTYRLTTESFWYTGLHPNDPTWREFMSQHPGLSRYAAYSWHNQPTIWWLYYASLQARTSHLAQHFATTLDAAATARSFGQVAAVDTIGAVLIGFGCASGSGGGLGGTVAGCATGGAAAGAVDLYVSALFSPLDAIIGTGSLFSTAVSDYSGGYTTFANGRTRIGETTVHSSITLAQGFVPESNFQLYTNIKQLLYDFGVDSRIDTGVYDIKAIEIK